MSASDLTNPAPAYVTRISSLFPLILIPLRQYSWLNKGDQAWQLTAGTLVALQSIPGLAILYAGFVKKYVKSARL